ncbi:hypothetical protein CW745_09060 [Psychromonas sp. psych-6C06]|uniref:Spy/CpxP family protein refolding chaperone n=1 Tax=Psychromonas sp. psych-6C06 TaxID=2058089 RepID=UPI000C336B6E|nr:Spy/CpxP family protein refolding chaperone [Psychromonas sp. psych-6C06]PKF61475.1 hypothetical protein CW745_09060 [Psychromonas sp. psych-6C06]
MKTKTIGAIIIATTLSLGGLSYAVAGNQDGAQNGKQDCSMMDKKQRGKHHGKHKNKQMGFEKLNLSAEQKQEMKSIMSSQKGKNTKSDSERQAQRAEMQALMHAEVFDEAKAKELINKQQTKKGERKLAKMKAKHQMFQLLTDEQKAQYAEMQMQRKNR